LINREAYKTIELDEINPFIGVSLDSFEIDGFVDFIAVSHMTGAGV